MKGLLARLFRKKVVDRHTVPLMDDNLELHPILVEVIQVGGRRYVEEETAIALMAACFAARTHLSTLGIAGDREALKTLRQFARVRLGADEVEVRNG